jgi:hypothetical protein
VFNLVGSVSVGGSSEHILAITCSFTCTIIIDSTIVATKSRISTPTESLTISSVLTPRKNSLLTYMESLTFDSSWIWNMGRIFTSVGTLNPSSQSTFSRATILSIAQTVTPDSLLTLMKSMSKTYIEAPATTATEGTANWWSTSFGYRKKLTLDNSAVSENLVNFPTPIVFSATQTDFWSHVNRTTGSDVRFVDSDNTTELYYEVEIFDTINNASVYWVKIPQIDSASSTDYIWMYYGYTGNPDSYLNSSSVWDSNYVMVHHMNGSAYTALDDSTANHNDVTLAGGTPNYAQTGQISQAVNFDGSSEYVSVNDSASFHFGTYITIECWVYKNTTSTGWYTFMGKNPAAKDIYFWVYQNKFGASLAGPRTSDWTTTVPVESSSWIYVTLVYNSTRLMMYKNGTLGDSVAGTGTLGLAVNTANLTMGKTTAYSEYWLGLMDEVRISNNVRSANWLKACYQYEVDQSKFTFASDEAYIAGTGAATPNLIGVMNWLVTRVVNLAESTSLTIETTVGKAVSIATQSIITVVSDMQTTLQRILVVTYSESASTDGIMIFVKSRTFIPYGTFDLASLLERALTKSLNPTETILLTPTLNTQKGIFKTIVDSASQSGVLNWLLCKVFSVNEQTSVDTSTLYHKIVGVTSENIMNIIGEMTVNQEIAIIKLAKTYSETLDLDSILILTKTQTYIPSEVMNILETIDRAVAKTLSQIDLLTIIDNMAINQAASRNVFTQTETEVPNAILTFIKTVSYVPSEVATLAESLGRAVSKSSSQTVSMIEEGTVGLAKSISKATVETVTSLSEMIKTQSIAVYMTLEKFDNLTVNSTFSMSFLPYSAPTNWELYFMFACVMLLTVVAIGIVNEKKH